MNDEFSNTLQNALHAVDISRLEHWSWPIALPPCDIMTASSSSSSSSRGSSTPDADKRHWSPNRRNSTANFTSDYQALLAATRWNDQVVLHGDRCDIELSFIVARPITHRLITEHRIV